jgi:sialidase-1
MSVSFLRDQLGGIQFFYGVKNSRTNLRFYVRRSSDEAKTWSDPVLITAEPGYHVMNNARVIQLKSGRILCPISFTSEVWTTNETFRTVACFSDDGGAHWRRGTGTVSCPKRGAMEPGLVELDDRRILQIIRTQTGRIWHCYSSDRGDTWTTPSPWSVAAPEAPSTLVRVPGDGRFLLVYNPGFSEGRDHGGRRTPLVAALSKDQGTTWSAPRMIESSPEATYAYVSVTFHKGRALLTFYHEPAETLRTSLRFKSIPLSWFAD